MGQGAASRTATASEVEPAAEAERDTDVVRLNTAGRGRVRAARTERRGRRTNRREVDRNARREEEVLERREDELRIDVERHDELVHRLRGVVGAAEGRRH